PGRRPEGRRGGHRAAARSGAEHPPPARHRVSRPIARAAAIALTGLTGTTVLVEAALSNQLPGMSIIGLPDTALAESKQRVRLAAQRAGVGASERHVVVNLSPAALPKHGSGFDLAIALAVAAASGHLPGERMPSTAHL